MTLNFRKIALTGSIALGTIIGVMAPAFSKSVSEYYAYVKDGHGKGGKTGVHADGSLKCHIGMAAVDINGRNETLVASKKQISELSINSPPTKMRADTKGSQELDIKKTARGKMANGRMVSE